MIKQVGWQHTEQLSNRTFREWQRYRGWTIKILGELENSGGMTTREISSRTGCGCVRGSDRLCKMLRAGLVERVERWGWRITGDGSYLLSLSYTATTQQQHSNNTATTQQQEKEEPTPPCFHASTCHIKQLCQDKRYTYKNMTLCPNCVRWNPGAWVKPRIPLEKKAVGSNGKETVPETLVHA